MTKTSDRCQKATQDDLDVRLFAAIERHRRANAAFMAIEESSEEERVAGEEDDAAWRDLLRISPRSGRGLRALLDYVLRYRNADPHCFGTEAPLVADFIRSIYAFTESREFCAGEAP